MAIRGFVLGLSMAVGLLATGGQRAAAQDESINREYQLKATYLYHFGQYVEWPGTAAAGDGKAFVIGVVGEDPFGQVLDTIAASKTIQAKKIAVRRFASVKDYTPCHILF